LSDSDTESKPKAPQFVPSFTQSSEHVNSPRHSVLLIETTIPAATPAPASPKSNSSGQRKNRKACFVCKMLTQSKPISTTAVRPVSADLPNITVTRPRHAYHVVTKGNPHQALKDKRVIDSGCSRNMTWNMSYLSDFEELNRGYVSFGGNPKGGKITSKVGIIILAALTRGNPQQALQHKEVIDSGCSRHMTRNMSYLSDFKELNRGYVAFGGNPKGGKITGKGKIKTDKFQGKVDEGFLIGYSMCSKAFRVFNSRTRIVQETLHSAGSTNPQDNDKDVLVDGKEHGVDIQKSMSADIHFSSSSAQTRKQADKTDNRVNAASSSVPTAGHNFINSTNNFSAAGPSNTASVGNKMHKAFPLPGESSHWQYKFPLSVKGVPTARRMEILLPGVCTAM
nr:ribonuclease H-like domain-containing protein [Tanacetum cinerariifolium]